MVQLVHVVLVVDQERSEAELALSAGVSDHETVFMTSHTRTLYIYSSNETQHFNLQVMDSRTLPQRYQRAAIVVVLELC